MVPRLGSNIKILITGRPGSGKTTLFSRVVSELKKNYNIAGFICPEVRESGVRIGFKIIDLSSGDEGWLAVSIARLGSCRGPVIGKYCVIEDDVSRVVARTRTSLSAADFIAIDEVGPMELKVSSSRGVIDLALSMNKPGIFVVHYRQADEIVSRLRGSGSPYMLYTIDLSNRDKLYSEILDIMLKRAGER